MNDEEYSIMQSIRSWIGNVLMLSIALYTTTAYSRTVQTNNTAKKESTTCGYTEKPKGQKVATQGKKKLMRRTRKRKKRQAHRKRMSLQNYEELEKEKERLLAKGYKEIAIKYIKKMIPLCADLEKLGNLMLEIADLHFDIGNLDGAESLYLKFATLHPGHTNAEYAHYKSILCSFWSTLDSDRDQSKTKETVERSHAFLERKKVFITYSDQVVDILASCQERLLESEINIFNFYSKQGDYTAAKTRLASIEKEFLPLLPNKEPLLLTLACDLAEKQQDHKLLKEKQTLLAEKFPEYNEQRNLIVTQKKEQSSMDKF